MPSSSDHRIIAADRHRVPAPYRSFAVRSDEPRHAAVARAPYGRLHALRTAFLDAGSRAGLAAAGRARTTVAAFSDIDYATATSADLAAAVPRRPDLLACIASTLLHTGVLGDGPAAYEASVASRIDYLVCCGAGFHNDVARHWSRCLFWILALDVADVEFVMPHAGVQLALQPGDLLVFDQTMAHGLCRPRDHGQAVASSFDAGADRHQLFLTGELVLKDAQWAALGAPWLPVQAPERRGALDLMLAQFDERSGAIQRLHSLRHAMQLGSDHDDAAAGVSG
jgi:hypothetical protein